jgi:hypothetical protein
MLWEDLVLEQLRLLRKRKGIGQGAKHRAITCRFDGGPSVSASQAPAVLAVAAEIYGGS